MNSENTYRIFCSGDAAVTIDWGNVIDTAINRKVISLFHYLQKNFLEGFIEAVPAYSSLTVYYDPLFVKRKSPAGTAFETMKKKLEHILQLQTEDTAEVDDHIRVPVCYDGDDLSFIATEKNRTVEEIISLHTSVDYRVYMLGFLPGFAYMGEVDERIAMPRKQQPRLKVPAGSVGIAGRQTGIYPSVSPGGWQLIGRTPLRLFDAAKQNPALLKAGDIVTFYSITVDEFKDY